MEHAYPPPYETSEINGKIWSKNLRRQNNDYLNSLLAKDIRLLDLGCGSGYFLRHMHDLYPHIELYGADISKEGLHTASVISPESNLVLADFNKLPFRNEFFDIVFSSNIFDFSWGKKKSFCALKLLWEVHDVLKHGGVYFVADINVMEAEPKGEIACIDDFFVRKNNHIFIKR